VVFGAGRRYLHPIPLPLLLNQDNLDGLLGRKVTADKVLEGLKGEGGKVMKTSLDHTKEAALQAALAGVQAAVPASTS
jgi:uncharacterized membrane protein